MLPSLFRIVAPTVCAIAVLGSLGCGGVPTNESSVYREGLQTESGEPAYITVQHCLIGFQGSVRGKTIVRTQEEAEELAGQILERARQGEDFGALVSRYTDDSAPGIYKMANDGFPGDNSSSIPSRQIFARSGMVPAFGDTGFPLEVGDVGLAEFDPDSSPFGWHIVKRIR